jgi:ABC-type glycerol-3-phosphate transport system substrate-binding protein
MHLKTRISAYTLAVALISSSGAIAQQKAEVLHWWTSAGESASVRVFADQFTKAGGTWVDNAIAGGANARTAGINRMVGGNPPTMMQFNTGKQFDELVSNDLVRDVDQQAQAGKWRQIMPKPIVDATVREGKFYAVPVNIHGQNWMFYNTKIFADAGLEPPKTFPELVASGEKLKAKGIIPIALGGQPNWEHNLFRAVVVGHGGADMFRQLYGTRKPDVVKSPKFKETVEVFPASTDKTVMATQDKLVQVLLDPATQIEFNKKKGSIPVRMDVDVSSMDVCAQKSFGILKDPANQVESMEILSPPNFSGAMQDAVTQYWNNPNMSADTFIEKIVNAMRDAG